jgi:hypothetical protein
MKNRYGNRLRGFTVIELMIILAIMPSSWRWPPPIDYGKAGGDASSS